MSTNNSTTITVSLYEIGRGAAHDEIVKLLRRIERNTCFNPDEVTKLIDRFDRYELGLDEVSDQMEYNVNVKLSSMEEWVRKNYHVKDNNGWVALQLPRMVAVLSVGDWLHILFESGLMEKSIGQGKAWKRCNKVKEYQDKGNTGKS